MNFRLHLCNENFVKIDLKKGKIKIFFFVYFDKNKI